MVCRAAFCACVLCVFVEGKRESACVSFLFIGGETALRVRKHMLRTLVSESNQSETLVTLFFRPSRTDAGTRETAKSLHLLKKRQLAESDMKG